MQGGLVLQSPVVFSTKGKFPLLALVDLLPCSAFVPRRIISPVSSSSLRCREVLRLNLVSSTVTTHASNVGIGSEGYEGRDENDNQKIFVNSPSNDSSSEIEKPPNQIPYPVSIAIVLFGCALVFSLIAFAKGAPSSLLAAIAKSGFTAAFSLIFVSEIGDKTFFIAALLAMQYKKGLVLLGSMGALSLMTVLSVIIGRIFHSVPAQFQTTLPVGEYAAIALLMFFGLKSIKDAWELPSNAVKDGEKNTANLDEFVEAEELVKEKASKRLSNPLEILWKSFSLVFFAMVKGTSSTLCYKGYTAEKEFFSLLAGHRMGMGRPFNACNNCSWCCSVSVGCGKWSHCWTPACNINCNSWRSISCQLHF